MVIKESTERLKIAPERSRFVFIRDAWSCLEWRMCANRNCRIRTFEIQFGKQLGYISKYLMFKKFKMPVSEKQSSAWQPFLV